MKIDGVRNAILFCGPTRARLLVCAVLSSDADAVAVAVALAIEELTMYRHVLLYNPPSPETVDAVAVALWMDGDLDDAEDILKEDQCSKN